MLSHEKYEKLKPFLKLAGGPDKGARFFTLAWNRTREAESRLNTVRHGRVPTWDELNTVNNLRLSAGRYTDTSPQNDEPTLYKREATAQAYLIAHGIQCVPPFKRWPSGPLAAFLDDLKDRIVEAVAARDE